MSIVYIGDRDNGKENGKLLLYHGLCMGIMEMKMEATIC